MPAERSRLVVRRPAGEYRDAIRRYAIKVDGTRVGFVRAGRELIVDVASGRHVVQATIDWSGSDALELDFEAGAETTLVVAPAGSAVEFWQAFTRSGYLTLRVE